MKASRRRRIQIAYNEEHHIVPQTIKKEIRAAIRGQEVQEEAHKIVKRGKKAPKKAKAELIVELEKQMREAAKVLDFERAMELRDAIEEIKNAS